MRPICLVSKCTTCFRLENFSSHLKLLSVSHHIARANREPIIIQVTCESSNVHVGGFQELRRQLEHKFNLTGRDSTIYFHCEDKLEVICEKFTTRLLTEKKFHPLSARQFILLSCSGGFFFENIFFPSLRSRNRKMF